MENRLFSIALKKNIAILITDSIAVGVILFLPAISHVLPFPLYYLDPMRLVLLMVYFVNRNYKNAVILAVGLPIFSMLYSGHPALFKAILISFELLVNILVLHFVSKKGINIFFAVLMSILFSKVIYYLSKFIFIEWSLISGTLFSTSLILQFFIALGLSLIFLLFGRKINSQE